ncbi:MAG: stage II sporulation protein M [Bacillota bacterium]|jgi:stage II sporulation protein M
MTGSLKTTLTKYFGDNLLLYYIIPVIFIIGIIFGILGAGELNDQQIKELGDFIDVFINSLPTSNVDAQMETKHALITNIRVMLYTWFLGLTVIGIPLTLFITFARGFVLGFTIGFLIGEKSTQGILLVLLTVLPQNIILIPVILAAAMLSISFSLFIIRGKFMGKTLNLSKRFCGYTITFMILGFFVALAAFIQGYLSPLLIKTTFSFIQ